MAAAVRKKEEDRHLKDLRELASLPHNRECFDCGQRGPTYVNMTIGSFVCSRCSGFLRGLTPPHRVKSISMATFTDDELDFIRQHGNEECARTWLGLLTDPKRLATRNSSAQQDYREHIIDKYEKQRYFLQPASPLKSIGAVMRNGGVGGGSSGSNSSSVTSPSSPSSSSVASDQNNNNQLKAIQLTPPAPLNGHSSRLNGRQNHNNNNNGCRSENAFGDDSLFSEVATRHHPHPPQVATAAVPNSQKTGGQNQWVRNFFGDDDVEELQGGGVKRNNLINNGGNSGATNGMMMTTTTAAGAGAGQPRQQMMGLNGTGGGAGGGGFVADFDSADIFNANVINGNGGNGLVPPKGGAAGLKRVNAVKRRNGEAGKGGAEQQENFADFDHNPIFNSAGVPMSMGSSNSSVASTPSADRYAALKDLDEQIREIKEKEVVQQQQPVMAIGGGSPFSSPNPFKAAVAANVGGGGAFSAPATNPFKVETNYLVHQATPYMIGLNATGGAPRSNNPFL